jgi:hypothetical protein
VAPPAPELQRLAGGHLRIDPVQVRAPTSLSAPSHDLHVTNSAEKSTASLAANKFTPIPGPDLHGENVALANAPGRVLGRRHKPALEVVNNYKEALPPFDDGQPAKTPSVYPTLIKGLMYMPVSSAPSFRATCERSAEKRQHSHAS